MTSNPPPISITDPADPRLAPFRSLRVRTEAGGEIPVAEGLRVLTALVAYGAPLRSVVTTPRDLPAVEALISPAGSVPIAVADRAIVSDLIGYRFHGGVLAALEPPATAIPLTALGSRIVALDRLDKGDNVGAIARTALAFGFTGLIYDRAGTTPFGRSAIRVSRGSVFGLAVRGSDDLAADLAGLTANGFDVIGATQDGTQDPRALAARGRDHCALVLGNEGEGLSREISATLGTTVRIPIDPRVESLNVAAAAAILCHALAPR